MRYVKNLLGLVIVVLFFSLAFLVSVAMIVFSVALSTGGNFGLIAIGLFLVGAVGALMMGGVLWLFVRNFSLRELMSPDVVASRDDAPVSLEIRLDKGKDRLYMLDSRHSPRATNPKKLGRGVFILPRKRGQFVIDKNVITLIDGAESHVTDIRNIEDKIHYSDTKDGKTHTITVAAVTEHTSDFEKKDAWNALKGGPDVSKEKRAEEWADSLKKGVK